MALNFEEFKVLQRILLMKLKQQTAWSILSAFNYDKNVLLDQAKLNDGTIRDEDWESCKNVELS
jgi:hypothetical protein